MSLTMPERITSLEKENEQCAIERKELDDKMTNVNNTLQQIRGGIRTLVVLWTIAMAVAGLVGVKHVTAAVAPAAAHP